MAQRKEAAIDGTPLKMLAGSKLFEFTLRGDKPPPEAAADLEADLLDPEQIDVLIAHSYAGDMWRDFTESWGYRAAIAVDLKSAMQIVLARKPRVVMSHLLFGFFGVNGPFEGGAKELLDAVRAADPSIKIIIATISKNPQESVPGADKYFSLPVTAQDLAESFGQYVGRPPILNPPQP